MTDLVPIAAFVRRHWPNCRHWPRERLIAWLDWYSRGGRLAIARDQNKIVGLGLARPLDRLEDRIDSYAHAENGPIIWVELAIAKHPRALPTLWRLMSQRYGVRQRVAFQRGKSHCERPHLYDFQKLNRRLQLNQG